MERNARADKGKSVFNCDKKRKQVFTAYNLYKRRKTKEYRETGSRISEEIYREGFDNLNEDQKESFGILAEHQLDKSRTLWDDLVLIVLQWIVEWCGQKPGGYFGNQLHPFLNWSREQFFLCTPQKSYWKRNVCGGNRIRSNNRQ